MTISAISTVTDVLAAYNAYTATTAEITAWNSGTGGVTTTKTSVGLFGADLTTFLADCAIAVATTACKVADYDNYNGWAIGVNFASTKTTDPNTDVSSVAFTDNKMGIDLTWTTAANVLKYYTSTVAIAAANPVVAEAGTKTTADNAFVGWSFKPVASTTKAQFAFFFQDATDTVYYEAGDTASVWFGIGGVASAANVNTAAFEFVGAAQLTVAASAAIVVALLF